MVPGKYTILTFFNFDNGKDKPKVRVDCVCPFKADVFAEKHRQDGYVELQESRSKSLTLQDNDSIRVFLKGNIQLPKGVPKAICILKFFKHASSNHITFPIERVKSQSYYGEIEYSVKKLYFSHSIRFDLKEKKMRNMFKAKACREPKGTVLSERSLSVLVNHVTCSWHVWERIGLRLGLQQDAFDNIQTTKEEDRLPLRLLNDWIGDREGTSESEMADELATAFEDNGQEYVASAIWKVMSDNRHLEPRDFSSG